MSQPDVASKQRCASASPGVISVHPIHVRRGSQEVYATAQIRHKETYFRQLIHRRLPAKNRRFRQTMPPKHLRSPVRRHVVDQNNI